MDRNKEPKRRGKVQLINETDVYSGVKSLGKKRRELSDTDQKKILDIYKGFEDSEVSRIVTADDLSFLDVPVIEVVEKYHAGYLSRWNWMTGYQDVIRGLRQF